MVSLSNDKEIPNSVQALLPTVEIWGPVFQFWSHTDVLRDLVPLCPVTAVQCSLCWWVFKTPHKQHLLQKQWSHQLHHLSLPLVFSPKIAPPPGSLHGLTTKVRPAFDCTPLPSLTLVTPQLLSPWHWTRAWYSSPQPKHTQPPGLSLQVLALSPVGLPVTYPQSPLEIETDFWEGCQSRRAILTKGWRQWCGTAPKATGMGRVQGRT